MILEESTEQAKEVGKRRRFRFHLHVEGNDGFCMYEQREEDVEFYAESTLDAYNMMIEHCLKEGYQRFSVESLVEE